MEEMVIIILGLVIGSFLNVLIYRLPEEKSIVKPGSFCPSCKTPIKPYDNIPVISYLILLGKCRHCKARIPFLYPAVEIFTGFSFWVAYRFFNHVPLHAGFTMLFLCLLIVLALIDLKHMILPLELTVGGAVVFLAYSFFNPTGSPTPLDAFTTAIGGAVAFAALYFFYLKIRKFEGLGQGDIWMMLLLGAFLGLNKFVVAILVASFSGLFVGIFFIIFKRKNLKLALPFGTFLSLGSYVAHFWGLEILRFIQSFYKL
jgi:leader peptidase (prepilin peptidase) / N-methyltransferase